LAQPLLFAIWLSFGPPPATKRVPLTIGAFGLLILAGGIQKWSLFPHKSAPANLDLAWVALSLALFAAFTIFGLVVKRLSRSRILYADEAAGDVSVHQFSLKYLIMVTTICAVLLGIGRSLANDSSHVNIRSVLVPIGLIFLAIFPVLIVPAITLSKLPKAYVLLGLVIVWVSLTGIATWAIIAKFPSVPRLPDQVEIVRQILFIQLGGAIAAWATAFVLRLCGYRLVGSPRATLPPLPSSG